MNHVVGEKWRSCRISPRRRETGSGASLPTSGGRSCFWTPGIHKPKSKLGEHLVRRPGPLWKKVDLILLLVDAGEDGSGDRFIIEHLKQVETPVFWW